MRAVLRPRVLVVAAAALVLAAVVGWFWLDRPRVVNTDIFGVAIRGYDPVAYFTEGRARKGTRDFELSWEGARWQFASAAHRDLFAADPERYAPQYGGHCSAALQAGQIASADPEAWIIIDGKLYLSYSKAGREKFRQGAAASISRADQEWARFRREVP